MSEVELDKGVKDEEAVEETAIFWFKVLIHHLNARPDRKILERMVTRGDPPDDWVAFFGQCDVRLQTPAKTIIEVKGIEFPIEDATTLNEAADGFSKAMDELAGDLAEQRLKEEIERRKASHVQQQKQADMRKRDMDIGRMLGQDLAPGSGPASLGQILRRDG